MEDWQTELMRAVSEHPSWQDYLGTLTEPADPPWAIHLAVFVEPFLGYVLDGTKTIESRFSENRVAPYDCVRTGDLILLKSSGGPVVGACRAGEVWYYRLHPSSFLEIRNRFARSMCAEEPAFWEARASAGYATLIRITDVAILPRIYFEKTDRRGWVVLTEHADQFELPVL